MIIKNIANDFSYCRQLLIGYSGGLDSTVLLYRLKLWRDLDPDVQLRAVHVQHGLSSKANIWEKHCIRVCREWNIPLIIKHIPIVKTKLGIEAEARKVRYNIFKKILLPNESLVIAHNLDDQCETFFLSLKRGSGPSGLSSMSKQLQFSSTQLLLRPLLNETRESLKNWAIKHSLQWIEDESNYDERYDRNFIRLKIIPILKKRWSFIHTTIARSAELCAEQENLIDELLDHELSKLISPEGALKITPLITISDAKRAAILRRWLASQGALMPSRSMLNRIWKEVAQARENLLSSRVCLPDYEIRRFKGCLWKIRPQKIFNDMTFIWNNLSKPLILPNEMGTIVLKEGGYIPFPKKNTTVSVRFKSVGKVNVFGRYGTQKFKKIWRELNIYPWNRATTPLVFYNETLVAVIGKSIYQKELEEKGIHFERNNSDL